MVPGVPCPFLWRMQESEQLILTMWWGTELRVQPWELWARALLAALLAGCELSQPSPQSLHREEEGVEASEVRKRGKSLWKLGVWGSGEI